MGDGGQTDGIRLVGQVVEDWQFSASFSVMPLMWISLVMPQKSNTAKSGQLNSFIMSNSRSLSRAGYTALPCRVMLRNQMYFL